MEPDVSTWRLTIQYDGAAFCGWQLQPEGRTVQGEIERALGRFFGGEAIRVNGAGRTDAGVHALGQVVSFRAVAPRPADGLRMGLNTMLPPDVSCIDAALVPDSFHARLSATGKRYRYIVLHRANRSPLLHGRACHIRWPLDWAAIDEGLAAYRGTHDFSSFRGPGCEERNPVRTIERAERIVHGDEHWIEIEGPGFLRHQVRIMVGTLLEIGEGRRPPSDIARLLGERDRRLSGRTAPPEGLYLVEVRYPASALELPASGA